LLYIAVSVEQYCDITRLNALPENEGILEASAATAYRARLTAMVEAKAAAPVTITR
jgi:hypothetical protein